MWGKTYHSVDLHPDIYYNCLMKEKVTERSLQALSAAVLVCAFLLTFTISDYYIFNRMGEFNALFVISQWIKKAAPLLIVMAVFYKKKCCADIIKYTLPPFVIMSCALFGGFFDITKAADTPAQEIYNSINLFFPRWLNMTLFFAQNAFILAICALLFVRDGAKIAVRSYIFLPLAAVACMPLNIFENLFDIDAIPRDSFLRFKSFTVWHAAAVAILIAFTLSAYFFLKSRNERDRNAYLGAMAVILLVQYHSKDSMVLGDGYNVYHTILACVPLFICNIGVYIASLSVLARKKFLYETAFFVHAAGAVSVFVYFGKDEMSNYGIFCSYSILYFTLTHALLFALSVLPSALGQYKFTMRDCVAPLIYYFVVIIAASICSAVVTSASMTWHTQDGQFLSPDEVLYPNYAFTQINPLPFEVPPVWTLRIWNYDLNMLYVLGLYAVYVAIFFAFTGAYYLFLNMRHRWLGRHIYAAQSPAQAEAATADDAQAEAAAADGSRGGDEDTPG